MPYLSPPSTQKTERTYRYFVQLVSSKLDHQGVPHHTQLLDLVVTEPTAETIEVLIAAAGWLEGYTLVSHWIPDDCPEF